MSVEKKDVRFKLDADDHAGLVLLAEADDVHELATWVERVVVREIRRRIHAATVIAERAKSKGISGRTIPSDFGGP
jgi:hypothetical protein